MDWSAKIIPESSPTLHCYLLDLNSAILHLCHELKHAKDTAKCFADGKCHYLERRKRKMVFLDRRFIKTIRPTFKLDWKMFKQFKMIKK